MGAICVSKQEKLQNQRWKQKTVQQQREKSQKLNNCVYAQKVKRYTQLYGREPTAQIKQFIQNNYNYDYNSQTRGKNYPRSGLLTLTYKSNLIDRFQTAYKNRYYTYKLEFIQLCENNNSLNYKWQIKGPNGIVYYDCRAHFDKDDKFKGAIFNEQEPPYDHDKYMRGYQPVQPKLTYNEPSSQNNFHAPKTDWNAYYNAQVARSNEAFRQNMNKQAQEWNNYATQKANRGW